MCSMKRSWKKTKSLLPWCPLPSFFFLPTLLPSFLSSFCFLCEVCCVACRGCSAATAGIVMPSPPSFHPAPPFFHPPVLLFPPSSPSLYLHHIPHSLHTSCLLIAMAAAEKGEVFPSPLFPCRNSFNLFFPSVLLLFLHSFSLFLSSRSFFLLSFLPSFFISPPPSLPPSFLRPSFCPSSVCPSFLLPSFRLFTLPLPFFRKVFAFP